MLQEERNVKKKHIEIASVYYDSDSQTFIYSILEFRKHCSSLRLCWGKGILQSHGYSQSGERFCEWYLENEAE